MCQPAGIISQYQEVEMYLCNMASLLSSTTTHLSTIISWQDVPAISAPPKATADTKNITSSKISTDQNTKYLPFIIMSKK